MPPVIEAFVLVESGVARAEIRYAIPGEAPGTELVRELRHDVEAPRGRGLGERSRNGIALSR